MDQEDERSNETKGIKKINLGPFRRSKVTRIIYVLYIIATIFLCMIILTPRIVGFFQRIFCHGFNYYYCDLLVGYDAVYRLGFAFAVWFMILAFSSLGITSSTERRAKVQNGYWVVKTIGLIFLELLFVLIPHGEYNGEIWLFFGLNAAFCFIILQYTFILDAANSFCILFQTITENEHGQFSDLTLNLLRTAKTFTTMFLYSVSLVTSVGFYFMYGSYYECLDNFVFITFHLIMCFASSVISLLPVVRDASSHVGLFQCAVTSLYCTYVMWLAFSSQPRTKCNPSDFYRFPGSPMANMQVWVTLFITFATLIYISTRDLVAPQFGKIEKVDSPTNSSEKLKVTYDLQEDGEGIDQPNYPKDNMTNNDNQCTSPKGFDKRISNLDVSGNLKPTYDLRENENHISHACSLKDNINRCNAFTSPKRLFENNEESHPQLKEPVLSLSRYSLNSDTSQLSSENKADTTTESENAALIWDNTLFLSATTKQTSAGLKTLAKRPKSSVIEKSNLATTGTPESLTLTETNGVAGGTFDSTRENDISTSPKTHSSKSRSIERRNFTIACTEEALTLAGPKGETGPLFETDITVDSTEKHVTCGSPKCLTNPSDLPSTESSDFATKAIPESLSLIAPRRESGPSTGEHFTDTSPKTNHSKSPLLECNNRTTEESPIKDTNSKELIWDDEVEGIEYSYPFFHLTFSLASLYLVMSITNWYRLEEGEHLTVRLVQSWSAVWLRVSASIFCSFIVIWSMIIPLLFPDTYKDLLFFQYLTSLPKY